MPARRSASRKAIRPEPSARCGMFWMARPRLSVTSRSVEVHLLAGLAHRELGDLRAADQAAERALGLAEADRLILPFAMTGSRELLEALPRHQTAHAALLADILDVLPGSSPVARNQPPPLDVEELSPSELRVLRISRRTCPAAKSQANCPSR